MSTTPTPDTTTVNLDMLGYRTMKWRSILIILAVEMVVFTIMNVMLDGTMGLLVVPLFSICGGWQMGVLSERNDWHKKEDI